MMTYKSPGILRTYQVNNTNMTLDFFTLRPDPDEPKFDMDQPYQRGVVWGLKRKRNLIKSLLMGVPIPAIILNDRFAAKFNEPGYDRNRNWMYAIVDGKQRISTIWAFMNNEFSCPAEWWDENAEGEVFWRDLELPHQRFFRGSPLPVANGQFKTLEQEEELFNLINFGGLAQGEVDEDV
jgi:hypothetical protein